MWFYEGKVNLRGEEGIGGLGVVEGDFLLIIWQGVGLSCFIVKCNENILLMNYFILWLNYLILLLNYNHIFYCVSVQ